MQLLEKHCDVFRYGRKDISFCYWSKTDGKIPPDTVLFLGAGQVGKIPKQIADMAEPGVVVVGGVPHWEVGVEDTEDFTYQYTMSVFQAVLRTFSAESMHVIAESQAAPAAIKLVDAMTERVRNFALVRPLGFTVAAYGKTADERMKNFRQRIRRSLLQFPKAFAGDPRNLTAGVIAARAMLQEPNISVLGQKYALGISYDSVSECRSAARKLHRQRSLFTLFLGEKDRIFPPHEVLQTIERDNIKHVSVEILPKTPHHTTLATRQGKAILRRVRAVLNNNEQSEVSAHALTPA